MSYVNNPANWKYTEKVRDKRLLYQAITTRVTEWEGLTGKKARVRIASEFRKLMN